VAGRVLTRNVEPGITIQPGKLLMTLSPSGVTELVVQIDEKNFALLRLGQKALASADAYPDRRFAAEITFISPAVDPLRGSVEIRLRVTEAPEYLRQEMTISVDIETARRADALIVPNEAIRDAGSGQPGYWSCARARHSAKRSSWACAARARRKFLRVWRRAICWCRPKA
jgi:HlyD family secretion protein